MLFVLIINNNSQSHNWHLKDSGIGLDVESMSKDLELKVSHLPMSYDFSLRFYMNDYSLPFVWFKNDELYIQFSSGNRCVVSTKSITDNIAENIDKVLIKRNLTDEFLPRRLSPSESNTLSQIIYRLKADAYIQ